MFVHWVILPGKGLEKIVLNILEFSGEKKLVELVSIYVDIGLHDFHLQNFVLLQALEDTFVAADGLISIHVFLSVSDFKNEPQSLLGSCDNNLLLLKDQATDSSYDFIDSN